MGINASTASNKNASTGIILVFTSTQQISTPFSDFICGCPQSYTILMCLNVRTFAVCLHVHRKSCDTTGEI